MRLIDADELINQIGAVLIMTEGPISYKKLKAIINEQRSFEYSTDKWCTDCKEYDHDLHCCNRFNSVIRKTLDEITKENKK